jgi:hypothetical protein
LTASGIAVTIVLPVLLKVIFSQDSWLVYEVSLDSCINRSSSMWILPEVYETGYTAILYRSKILSSKCRMHAQST